MFAVDRIVTSSGLEYHSRKEEEGMKRTIVMLFAVMLMVLAAPSTAKAADEVTLTIAADKTTVNPGDTITFTVSISPVGEPGLGGLEFDLLIPEGMAIIDESVSVPEGLADTFDADPDEILKPRNGWPKWSHSARKSGYVGTAELRFLTFSCTVGENVESGEKSVDMDRDSLSCFDNSPDLNDYDVSVNTASFTVEEAQTPAACVHTMEKTDAVAPTCGKDGNIEYYTCSKCGKKFTDEAGTREVVDITVPATGQHGETEVRGAVEATDEKDGYTGDTYCKVCGNKIADGTVVQKLSHTHAMVKTEAVKPGCENDGNVEYYTCSKCQKKFADEAGTKEISDVVIKAAGHTGSEWQKDGESHWKVCSVCGKEFDKESHQYGSDSDSDCDTCGYKRFYVISSGANAVYETGTETGLTITADGDYKLFKELQVDGNLVDAANYEAKEGSTVITLKKDYLDTLTVGEHIIRFVYTDEKAASAGFTVKKKDEAGNSGNDNADSGNGNDNNTNAGNSADNNADIAGSAAQEQGSVKSPETGEENRLIFWSLLAVTSLSLAVGMAVNSRKQKK